jgi:quercetin dioxygenase-like cupin family protein
MSEATDQPYHAKRISVIAKGEDVLVREYVLRGGESIPWHHHTLVTDHYYGLEGKVLIETRPPLERHELTAGASVSVTPPTEHHVSNPFDEPCRFLLVQGVGKYDFIKDE